MSEVPGMIRPELQELPQIRDRMTFLYFEHCKLSREDGTILRNPITDTLLLVRRRLPGVRDLSLSAAAERLELATPEKWNVVSECETTVLVYEKLKNEK